MKIERTKNKIMITFEKGERAQQDKIWKFFCVERGRANVVTALVIESREEGEVR